MGRSRRAAKHECLERKRERETEKYRLNERRHRKNNFKTSYS